MPVTTIQGVKSQKISTRNCIEGTVVEMKEGPVSTEITIETAHRLLHHAHVRQVPRPKVGAKAYAVIQASNVMLAVD